MKTIVMVLLGALLLKAGPPWLGGVIVTMVVAAVGLSASSLLLMALFPAQAEAVRCRLSEKPLRCCLLGWLLLLSQILVLSITQAPLLGVLLALVDLVLLWVGWSGLSLVVADRLKLGETPWRRVACSQGVLCSCLGLPVAGWLVAFQAGLAAMGATLCR